MALKLNIDIKEIEKYPNLFMIEDLLIIKTIETEDNYVFMGISNSMYQDKVIQKVRKKKKEDKDTPPQIIEIKIPSSLDELNQMQTTLEFAYHLFAGSQDTNQKELCNVLLPNLVSYKKKLQILALQTI